MTKEGNIAGPRVLEHMVDAVLYFEGDRGHQFRILRAVKNRFGATDEIGVFEMTDRGLARGRRTPRRCSSPSGAATSPAAPCSPASRARARCWWKSRPCSRPTPAARPGAPWSAGIRAGSPCCWRCWRRGAGCALGATDVYLNVAGGLRIAEPAADLAVAAALASAASDRDRPGCVFFGEVGLSGEVRQVAQAEARLKEAQKLGFGAACLPRRVARGNRLPPPPRGWRCAKSGISPISWPDSRA